MRLIASVFSVLERPTSRRKTDPIALSALLHGRTDLYCPVYKRYPTSLVRMCAAWQQDAEEKRTASDDGIWRACPIFSSAVFIAVISVYLLYCTFSFIQIVFNFVKGKKVLTVSFCLVQKILCAQCELVQINKEFLFIWIFHTQVNCRKKNLQINCKT